MTTHVIREVVPSDRSGWLATSVHRPTRVMPGIALRNAQVILDLRALAIAA